MAAGLALEGIFSRATAEENSTKKDTNVAAPLLLSTLGLIPVPSEIHLADRISPLKSTAESLLETDAVELRKRQDLNLSSFEKLPSPDQVNWSKLVTGIQNTFSQLEQQVVADKEELEILWWLQNGISKRLNQSFISMPAFTAAFYAGFELAEMVILPLNSMAAILQKIVEKDRKAIDLKPRI